ncbi:TetR/AcrR family transcriptional regulator [Rhizosphaericola mali]|uniref:TetR/AcrR family transcriptional regulator n=1 Tax=Rhizosphaericola mali TaxID=2545455 RepID=A0A5P2G5K6_9BACT|nr:TetR/AcrR family transcriptional regulator [Rhizosphaericola mali]QES89439.1 TetR/AcrR family transcriptional regulator [Rhizosphaericola mali]
MRTRDAEKEQLVKQKTIELIVKEGFESFSINKLAKACGISVATLYIYYESKEDLLTKIGTEHLTHWNELMLQGLDEDHSFEEGMRMQWANRIKFYKTHPNALEFFDQMRASSFQKTVFAPMMKVFKESIGAFLQRAIDRKEMVALMTPEIFFSIAFVPLHNLIRFDFTGKSMGGQPFELTERILWHTFDLVMKALKP